MNRRQFLIRAIGAAIIAGGVPTFMPNLLPEVVDTPLITSARTFNELLQQYYEPLLMKEIFREDYLLTKVAKGDWGGKPVVIPFRYTEGIS